MTSRQPKPRSLIILGAILIQLALGILYAWSVFTPPLEAVGWSKIQTQYVFSAALISFAIVMVMAGKLLPKVGPRKLAISGGVLLGLAYLLAGFFGKTNVFALISLLGVLSGVGIGLAYVVPIAVGMRWFPDKKGLITGLAVAGFGFGATLWVKLAGSWGKLLTTYGLSKTLVIYGLVLVTMAVVGGWQMKFPPEGWKPDNFGLKKKKTVRATKKALNLNFKQVLRTVTFYKIFSTFMFSASAGLMTIGLMKLFPKEALVLGNPKISENQASAIAGTAMAVFFSLANGIGRIVWGTISDKIGRKLSIIIMTASQGLLMTLFPWFARQQYSLYVASSLIGFNFGGNFALFPAITADAFGAEHFGQNYGWVFLSYGLAGILGPVLGGRLGDLQNFPLAFSICGVLCLVSSGIGWSIKSQSPKRPLMLAS
ncbi:OFA family MFS transporter [Patescibacteria group bacterium]